MTSAESESESRAGAGEKEESEISAPDVLAEPVAGQPPDGEALAGAEGAEEENEADLDLAYLKPIVRLEDLRAGQVVRRFATGQDQQGRFQRLTDDGQGCILTDVIDLRAHEYLSEAGIVRPSPDDRLVVHSSSFADQAGSKEAWEVVRTWQLFREHPELGTEIQNFVQSSFSPAQILDWKKRDRLKWLFKPIQHRFKIGRHKEKVNWDAVRIERFGEELRKLGNGKHMTYVAFIPRDTTHPPMYYTFGTKPHLETMKQLQREPFAFRPNHGGHIKCIHEEGTEAVLLVDAGSNDLGAGMHTPLAIAELVVEGLKKLYPDLEYKPVPGREAFGIQQSY